MVLTGGTVSLFILEYQASPVNTNSIFSGVPFTFVPHLKQYPHRQKFSLQEVAVVTLTKIWVEKQGE